MAYILYQAADGGTVVMCPTSVVESDADAAGLLPAGVAQFRVVADDEIPQGANWAVDWADPAKAFVTTTPQPVVPHVVSMFQCKAALLGVGKLADANALVAGCGVPFIILAWAEGTEMRRNSPSLAALAPSLGLDDAALDALFIAAAQIQA